MKVLDIVKSKLPEPLPGDAALEVHIEEVGQAIMNYCNRKDIPNELRFVHANMVIDLINHWNRKNNPESGVAVASVKEGDATVQFKSVGIDSTEQAMKGLLFGYAEQLNKFRKLRW